MMRSACIRASLALLVGLLAAGCQQLPASFAGPAASASAPDRATEPATGAVDGAADSVAKARETELKHLQSLVPGLADMPVAQAYFDRLIERIQAAGPQPPVYARVLVRPKLTYNAATTAEGFIIVDLGWLKTIDSESELVALLAHEYGHARLAHHGVKNSVGFLTHLVTLAGAATASKTGTGNYWSMTLVNAGWSDLLMPSWSRSQEFEADDFAIDTTQAMGYAYVPSVRAFLERIQSIERAADRAAPRPAAKAPMPAGAASQAAVADAHPRIEDRLAHAQKTVEGRPRARPQPRGADGWKSVKESAAFRAGEAEYLLTEPFLTALQERRVADLAAAAKRVERSPKPLTTGVGLTAAAFAVPDPRRQVELLRAATAASDASFLPYQALAGLLRDQANDYEGAAGTLQAALDRFDSPPQHYPFVLEFRRVLGERIQAIPADKRPLGLTVFGLKNAADALALRTRCMLYPEWSEACTLASLTDAQKKAREQAAKAKDDEMAKRVGQKVERALK